MTKFKASPRGAKKLPGGLGRNYTDSNPVKVRMRQEARLAENKRYLKNEM